MSASHITKEERRRLAWEVMKAALAAADPMKAVRRVLRRDEESIQVGKKRYPLKEVERILVVGGGKAGAAMACAVEEILGDLIHAGMVNVKYGHLPPKELTRIRINEAGHPIPDQSGLEGALKMTEMLKGLTPRDLVFCLISGGGSALLPLPQPDLTLADKQAVTDALLRCGATINEINAVRKHLSRIKGGQLARLAQPAAVISLILSDVVGSPLDTIASGPTAPDSTTFADAYGVLERYGLLNEVPASVVEHLRKGVEGELPETPKPGDPLFERVQNVIVGDNRIAALAAVEKARELGLSSMLLSTYVEGEAREVGRVFAALGKELARWGQPLSPPACLVAGGETTVTIKGKGLGGRNQELALSAAIALEGWEEVMVIGLATDGTDGPTDAAGAFAEGDTVRRAREKGLSPQAYLADNDSYHFFQALGDLLVTGPTNTNVNDLVFVFVWDAD